MLLLRALVSSTPAAAKATTTRAFSLTTTTTTTTTQRLTHPRACLPLSAFSPPSSLNTHTHTHTRLHPFSTDAAAAAAAPPSDANPAPPTSTTNKKKKKKKRAPPSQTERGLINKLSDEPVPVIWEALQKKCEREKMPRLHDYHLLLLAAAKGDKTPTTDKTDTHTQTYTCMLDGLKLLNKKRVEFRQDTVTLFLRACARVGMLGEGVEVLMEREKRLGMWAGRDAVHKALYLLGRIKDTERMLKLFEAMPADLGVQHTARTYHIVITALLHEKQGAKALEVASKVPPSLLLADSTQEMLKSVSVSVVEEEKGEGEGEAAPAAAAGEEVEEKEGEKKE